MIRLSLAPLALLALATQIQAGDRICHTSTVFPTPTPWSVNLSVPQFDPAQGTLTAVHVVITTDSLSTLAFESPDAAPQFAEVSVDSLIELRRPDTSLMATATSATVRGDFVAPFDGSIDFGGASGRTFADVTEKASQATTLTAPADLALFTGTGSFTPDLVGSDSCVGSCACGLIIQCTNFLGAVVRVCYEYEPKPTVEHTFTIPQTTTAWNQVAAVPAFDPSLGKLNAVVIDVCATLSGSHGIENVDIGSAANVDYSVEGTVDVLLPDLVNGASVTATDDGFVALSPFDGSLDFAGTSGATLGHGAERAGRVVLSDPGVLAQLIGDGTVPLTVAGSSTFSAFGGVNLVTSSSSMVGATVTVGYVFEPCSSVLVSDFVPLTTLNWVDSVTLPRFDTALGELRGVLLTVEGEFVGTLGYENQDALPREFVLEGVATLDVQRPDTTSLASEDLRVFAREFADPVDSTIDFAGPGGGTVAGLRDTSSVGLLLDSAADKALFTGTGIVTLPVLAFTNCVTTGGANFISFCQTSAGITVSARYLYDPPAGTPSCFGVGCPCANDDPAAGCANSTGSGALLSGYGLPSVSCDTLVLSVTGMPSHQNGLFYMGDTQVSNVLFDGRQCALGVTFRFLDSIQSSGAIGQASFRDTVASSGGLITAGSTWYFHFWHRDTAGSPCGTGANLTNLLGVTYLP